MVVFWFQNGIHCFMATITIKNIPDRIYQRLKFLAKKRHRSLNSEIIHCLERSIDSSEVDPEEIRLRAKLFREKIKGEISPEEIEKAINQGRP